MSENEKSLEEIKNEYEELKEVSEVLDDYELCIGGGIFPHPYLKERKPSIFKRLKKKILEIMKDVVPNE